MSSLQTAARKVGILYLVFALLAILDEFYLARGFLVPGDAAATAGNIAARELTYRTSLLVGFVVQILFVFLVVGLYRLFRNVDEYQALLMVLFVTLGIAVSLGSLVSKTAPLVFLTGADAYAAFTPAQQEALALSFLGLRRTGAVVATGFWGLWLFPFGILCIKSGFIPKIFGILLLVSGVAYVTSSFTGIVAPTLTGAISPVLMPLYFGEVAIIFWLVIKGARMPAPVNGASPP